MPGEERREGSFGPRAGGRAGRRKGRAGKQRGAGAIAPSTLGRERAERLGTYAR